VRLAAFALALAFVCGAASTARALDCDNVTHPFVAVLCSDPDLKRAADERQAAWDQTWQRLNEEQRAQLKQDELAWIRSYPVLCGISADQMPALPVPSVNKDCMLRAGEMRTAYIRAYGLPAGGAAPAPAPAPDTSANPSYAQGVADWQALYAWFTTLSGARRAGADYWAGNRSNPGHESCAEAADNYADTPQAAEAFEAGCNDAKSRLDSIDVRRADPQYRAGFNDEAKQLPIPAPPPPPRALTARLTINNHSCRNITEVKIDDVPQNNGIGPGDSGRFLMDDRCTHTVHGTSGIDTWNSAIQCKNDSPYENFTITWVATNHPPVENSLGNESLIVERISNNDLGQVQITSKTDCLAIERIDANRGNCKTNEPELPQVLKFGQTLTISYFCEKLLEFKITTDQGVGVFTFDR